MPKPTGQTFDAAHLIKVAACIVAFICAAAFLAVTNKELQNDYLLLFTASTAVPWLLRLGAAMVLFVMLSGIVSVLVRPVWLALVASMIASVLYALILGSDLATWASSGLIAAMLFIFMLYVGNQLKNQINFSAHPLSDMKLLLLSVLTISTCVSFGLGYLADSSRRDYLVPPGIKTALVDFTMSLTQGSIDAQSLPPALKKAATDQVRKTVASGLDDAEKSLQPYKSSIPVLLGVTLFSLLSTVLFVLAFVPLLLTRLVFAFLRLTGFAKVATETREVKHLVI